MTADIARASRIRSPALRRRCCDRQKERDDEKKSGHVVCLHLSNERDQKPVPQTALEPVTPSLRSENSPSSGSSRQDSPDTLKSPSQRVLYNVGPIHSSELQRTVMDTGRMRGIAAAQQRAIVRRCLCHSRLTAEDRHSLSEVEGQKSARRKSTGGRLRLVFFGLRRVFRPVGCTGLSVPDGLRQHLPQLSLRLRWFSGDRRLPLSHSRYVGMPEGELNPRETAKLKSSNH